MLELFKMCFLISEYRTSGILVLPQVQLDVA